MEIHRPSHPLYGHLRQYISISPEEFKGVLAFFEPKRLEKRQMLMESGSHCSHIHFVLEGCLNMFFTTQKGTERTVQFAIENWWLTDFLAFQNGNNTNFSIRAVEPTHILSLRFEQHERLLSEFPKLEGYFRKMYQIGYGASLIKMKYLLDFSKEDMYFHFTESFPDFAQRVPQKLIASFLGLTPEYVSEIRAKKRS
nr:Crp/Fnr family transcriptional regulator [Allomuricauda sp.]